MRSLNAIIDSVLGGQHAEPDEMRYAIAAMHQLAAFDRRALMNLAEGEAKALKVMLTHSAQWQWEEHFRRRQSAGEKSPKEWLGWNNDPDNPNFQVWREASTRLVESVMQKASERL